VEDGYTRAKEGLVWGWRFRRLVSAIYCPNRLPTRRACHSDRANSTSEVSRRRSCYRFPDSSSTSIPNWWRQWLLQYLSHTKFYENYFDFSLYVSYYLIISYLKLDIACLRIILSIMYSKISITWMGKIDTTYCYIEFQMCHMLLLSLLCL